MTDRPKNTNRSEDDHTKRGKFRRGNAAASKGGLHERTMLSHTDDQRTLWESALEVRNLGIAGKAGKRSMNLQDWMRETLDAEAKRQRRTVLTG